MSLAKVARGGQSYYLRAVAGGVEDHRPPGDEPDGTWLGGASTALGLDGQVTAAQLEAVLAGAHPHRGEVLSRTHSRVKVAGYDLVFGAPKSVSLLFALGQESVAAQVLAAHGGSVAAALGYLEREAVRARRGSGSRRRVVETTGVVGAGFLHRTSRAPDPHLHTHVLVANLVGDHEGRWSALDARGLYLHSRTAGCLYRAQLRQELTERLGLSWTRTALGVIDVDGMDPLVPRGFSRRRLDIEAALAEEAASSAKAAQVAALTTRPPKDLATSFESLVPQWRDRAAAMGLGPEQLAQLTGRAPGRSPDRLPERPDPGLLGPEGLTAHASSFSRQEVVRAVCEASLGGGRVAAVEALADGLLGSDRVRPVTGRPPLLGADTVRRADGRLVWGGIDVPRWTTAELVSVEERMVDGAHRRRGEKAGLARPAAVEQALGRRPGLDTALRQSVRALVGSGAGVVVVAASTATLAGDGLDAARDAWEASGLAVVGTGPGPGAAGRLEAASGMESVPLSDLLGAPGDGGGGLRSVDVVVVDQAGAVDSRTLDHLLVQAAAYRVKVVLVSDPRRVGLADTGGWHRLADRLGPLTLGDPAREPGGREAGSAPPPERQADEIVTCPAGRSTVKVGPTLESLRQQVVDDWMEARLAGQRVIMVAARPVDVELLNSKARERLAAAAQLAGGTPVRPSDQTPAVSVRQARTLDAEHLLVLGDSQLLARARCPQQLTDGAGLYVVDRSATGPGQDRGTLDRFDRLADSLGRAPPTTWPARSANLSLADLAGQREELRGRLSAAAAALPADGGAALALIDQDRARAAAALSAAPAAGAAAGSAGREGDEGRRRPRWRQARLPGEQVTASPTAGTAAVARWRAEVERLDARRADLRALGHRRAQWGVEHGEDLARYRQLGTAIERREQALARAAEAAPPAHLVAEIGDRPVNPTDRVAWRQAARRVESYRERWQVGPAGPALDERPSDLGRQAAAGGGPAAAKEAARGAGPEAGCLSRRAERDQAAGALERVRLALRPERTKVIQRDGGLTLG